MRIDTMASSRRALGFSPITACCATQPPDPVAAGPRRRGMGRKDAAGPRPL
ncbi:hypothetical protein IV454_18730 [Massilia antarctica]|uniref:Uncharacterized protein n=1 Tax=Massilia antarctica TaxID=2765360 RepID=A0AA48W9V1_9BURK|nr:hypothetical protein [Massilia antarctica]QPI47624.1 hypothetical protein IV454_18730 [Massilia antarctica]